MKYLNHPGLRSARATLAGAAILALVASPGRAQFASCTTAPSGSACLSAGRVGIDNMSPAYPLDLGTGSQNTPTPTGAIVLGAHGSAVFGAGDATTLIDSFSNSGALYFSSGNGHPSFSVVRSSNITNNDYTIYSMRNLVFTPGVSWHSIFSVGNVGIGGAFSAGNGTSPVPPSSLSVAGGVSIGSYATSTTNAGTGNLNLSGSIGVGTQSPGYKLDVQGGQINASGGLCIAGTCQTSWPVSNTSGNFGIGTSSPSATLEVQKSQHAVTRILVNNPDTTTSDYGTQAQVELQIAGNSVGGIKTTAKNLAGLSTNALYLTTEGPYPVAIGTNASALPAMAVGATAGGVSIRNSYVATDPGAGNLIVSGIVGIGASSPCSGTAYNCKLAVKGAIRANEVVVDTAWSDYVFDPAYHLQSLREVAAYVTENHHLPDIPSAQDVAEKGVSIGEMQSKLLAKIEELTLRLIELDDRNRRLEAESRHVVREVHQLRNSTTGAERK